MHTEDLVMGAILSYFAGGIVFGMGLADGGPLEQYPRLVFTLWLFSPVSLPITTAGGICLGLFHLVKWWLWEPFQEWQKSRAKKAPKAKPTWDDLGRQVEELWRDVEKIGRSL